MYMYQPLKATSNLNPPNLNFKGSPSVIITLCRLIVVTCDMNFSHEGKQCDIHCLKPGMQESLKLPEK